MTIATSRKLGVLPVHVGLWDVTEQVLARMRSASGIRESVLEPHLAPPLRKVA